jgi:hypothetical protein
MSSATSVNDALAGYVAGRVTAQQLVGVVAAAYYGEGGRPKREALAPVIDIIERAHPGVVELSSANDRPGFAVRLAERPFPKTHEAELRNAVATVLNRDSTLTDSPARRPGLFQRLVNAIRRVFRV